MGCVQSRDNDVVLEGEVNFDHFRIIRSIGRGAFGKVCIVEKLDTKKQYAMKYVNKQHCLNMKCGVNTLREERILATMDGECPFVVNLWFAFQDVEDLFFVVDYMAGGDLGFHLKSGKFTEERTRGYVAEISLALDYLHKNNIIHRDIKPDNLILDAKGHVHLTDFNVAYIRDGGKKPRSTAGTRPYMAPEVLLASKNESGYTAAVDWWSLGVTMYEFLSMKRPFNIARGTSSRKIQEYFRSATILFPKLLSDPCIDVIQAFLRVTPAKRLQTLEAVKKDQFFKSLDFDAVWRMEIPPCFTPQADHINCDPMHELEEMIVEPEPLHKKKNRLKKRASQRRDRQSEKYKDLFHLEDNFFVFNREKGGIVEAETPGDEETTESPTKDETHSNVPDTELTGTDCAMPATSADSVTLRKLMRAESFFLDGRRVSDCSKSVASASDSRVPETMSNSESTAVAVGAASAEAGAASVDLTDVKEDVVIGSSAALAAEAGADDSVKDERGAGEATAELTADSIPLAPTVDETVY